MNNKIDFDHNFRISHFVVIANHIHQEYLMITIFNQEIVKSTFPNLEKLP